MSKELKPIDNLKPLHHSTCGAVSGFLTRIAVQPLDVLKIRFQLQSEPIRQKFVAGKPISAKYSGIIQALCLIVKEEGFSALWKGHVPAQGLSLIYGSAQFATFEFLQRMVSRNSSKRNEKPSMNTAMPFISGGIAGTTATFICHPLDVVRTRFVAQGEPKIYTGIIQGVRCMLKEGGISTFYKGFTPTLIAIFPNASFHFGFYHVLRQALQRYINEKDVLWVPSRSIQSLACGAISGMASKILLLPFDVIKKRLQIQGFEQARQSFGQVKVYTGMSNCFWTIISDEGISGLYKGAAASVLKSSIVVALTFASYEQCCYCFRCYLEEE